MNCLTFGFAIVTWAKPSVVVIELAQTHADVPGGAVAASMRSHRHRVIGGVGGECGLFRGGQRDVTLWSPVGSELTT